MFPRKPINKLGVAPLTSMFLFGENDEHQFDDHRPEVHDSDGLLQWNGNDEWLWRPLDNSKYLRISSFEDNNPKGFGLMQRDRNPEHYLDFEAYYEQRPSVWVEPLDQWGEGTVQLIEIPSLQETHDNVVAFWPYPNSLWRLERNIRFRYRLHWTGDVPIPRDLAKVTATYSGIGGVSGMLETDKRKFVIDFSAPKNLSDIKELIENGEIVPDVSISEGKLLGVHLMYNPVTKGPTLYMDFRPERQDFRNEGCIAPRRPGRFRSVELPMVAIKIQSLDDIVRAYLENLGFRGRRLEDNTGQISAMLGPEFNPDDCIQLS